MGFWQEIESINLAILNGGLEVGERALLALEAKTPPEMRTKLHYQSIVAFHRGEVFQAKQILESAAKTYGDNVNLLRDLIVCQYHLRDMNGFRANLDLLEKRLKEFKTSLTPRTLFNSYLMLGKFLEEEAHLAPAAVCYEEAFNYAQNPQQKLRALIQKARWCALYQPVGALSSLYRELISSSPDQMTRDLQIELEHSLMLIEMRLIGVDHAWQRIARLHSEIEEIDSRLVIFDFAEGVLLQDFEIEPSVLQIMSRFKELDPFETFIWKMAQETLEATVKLHELSLLAAQVPWAPYLRLLCLAANRESSLLIRQELNRKIQLIVRSLDPESQALWNQRLKQSMQTPEIRIEYSMRRRVISVHGRSVDLSKKKIGLQLLSGLAIKTEMSVDEAIRLVWQSEFSPEHYHRLRMGVHRLNSLIHKATGLGKVVEVDSQTVRLRPEVRLKLVDEHTTETEMLEL